MTDEVLVDARNLQRWFGRKHAVADVSLRARRGEVVGLLGINGAGKTTTLQMLCGVLPPSSGSVTINGLDLLRHPGAAKRQLGYLPDQPAVHRELLVDEQLDFWGSLHGLRGRRLQVARDSAKSRCDLEAVGRRRIGGLSKGFQQRLGIAQAIMHDPSVIVLDEPTVGLDPLQIRDIRALIRTLGNRHCVVLSTHVLAEVQAVCDRVMILKGGRVRLDSALADLGSQVVHQYRISLAAPPATSVLQALTGVERCATSDGDTLTLDVDASFSATDLAQTAVSAGWGLRELTPVRPGLEETFVRLTLGEGASDTGLEA